LSDEFYWPKPSNPTDLWCNNEKRGRESKRGGAEQDGVEKRGEKECLHIVIRREGGEYPERLFISKRKRGKRGQG